jgi:hypothetical protein
MGSNTYYYAACPEAPSHREILGISLCPASLHNKSHKINILHIKHPPKIIRVNRFSPLQLIENPSPLSRFNRDMSRFRLASSNPHNPFIRWHNRLLPDNPPSQATSVV